MEKYCFVIQPISNNTFVKRFDDIYQPSIEKAGLKAYRVDLDPKVNNILDSILKKIKESTLCLADISIDNPNVWYELGYAYALQKDIVLVCDSSRKEFPFDISIQNIIKYKSESTSDFQELSKNITTKLLSFLDSQMLTDRIIENPINPIEGFASYELSIMAFIMSNQYSINSNISIDSIRKNMNNIGFNDLALSVGLHLLVTKHLVEVFEINDYDSFGNEFPLQVCKLSEDGIQFCINNINLFDLKTISKSDSNTNLPF